MYVTMFVALIFLSCISIKYLPGHVCHVDLSALLWHSVCTMFAALIFLSCNTKFVPGHVGRVDLSVLLQHNGLQSAPLRYQGLIGGLDHSGRTRASEKDGRRETRRSALRSNRRFVSLIYTERRLRNRHKDGRKKSFLYRSLRALKLDNPTKL